ncbi:MAG TPA: type VI secretion system tip protein VgrG, partial [Nannocystis sp.]
MGVLSTIWALIGNRPVFTYEVEGLAEPPRVTRLSGHEGLSRPYEFRVELACGPEVELADLSGKAGALCIEGIDEPRFVHGIIGEVDYVGESRNYGLFEVVLVPTIWRLKHRHDCRIFQHKTTEEVVRQVLKAAGVSAKAYRFDLHGNYTARNYCVQYRESDLAFISRLLEEDGIFYFFEHTAESHVMVIADHVGAHPRIPGADTVWWNPPGGLLHAREHVLDFRFGQRIRPGTATLRDFHFPTPTADMQAREQAADDRDLEVYDYPGEYREAAGASLDRGQMLAKVRLQELQSSRRVGSGKADCMRLVPGHTFHLAGHGRGELNLEYLLTGVVHHGRQPQALDEDAAGEFSYSAEFTCMERSVPYRPARATPRPFVRGLQSATVVGPAGEEVHTDDQGRVMVQFHWDRQGERDEQSSCWVRVSQLWAGAGWGAMFLPRIGHEVLVDFLEGDPDRPIITGRAYHGLNDLPYALPAEKTKSTIKSDSSRGGGGYNELRFEDRKGEEQVFIRAEKNLDIFVQHDRMEDVHHDRHLRVGETTPQGKVGDYNQLVLRDKHTRVERDTHTHIGGNVLLRIGGIDGEG